MKLTRPNVVRRTVQCGAALALAVLVTATTYLALADAPGGVTSDPGNTLPVAVMLDLTPESLTAAGFDDTELATIMTRLGNATQLRQGIATQLAAAAQASAAIEQWTKTISLSGGGGGAAEQLQTAVQQLQTAQTQMQQAQASLLAAALDEMPTQQVDLLTAIRAAQHHGVPTEFKVTARSEGQWKAIVGALRAEARATRMGTTLAPAHGTLLESIRGETDVISAKLRLDTDLSTMQTEYASVLSPS